jgi:hypothetical protein
MAYRPAREISAHLTPTLRITPETRVASAGSCFAQHISRALVARGYNYFVTEKAPAFLSPEAAIQYNYGIFSARYGNIYTPLQLFQLVERSFDNFQPADQYWIDAGGRCFDLLRPRLTKRGFASQAEAEADTRRHLSAVRDMFAQTDVFVFTLGLTEGWVSTADGTVYPTCPGCGSAGDHDAAKYAFHNFSVTEAVEHLAASIRRITVLNPTIQIVLTVSPVPLVATMEPRHVLQATTYSKAVLRIAAEEMVRQFDNVHYFASYELITATGNTQAYLAEDRRTVSPEGVACAMAAFFDHFAIGSDAEGADTSHVRTATTSPTEAGANVDASAHAVVCDEAEFYRALARSEAASSGRRA